LRSTSSDMFHSKTNPDNLVLGHYL